MAPRHWPDLGPPGSRARSFDTCQVLRPRRVNQALAITRLVVLPSAFETESAPGNSDFVARWLACALPYRRFVDVLANDNARLGADADRYSFIVSDFHRLLPAGLPAHFESNLPGWGDSNFDVTQADRLGRGSQCGRDGDCGQETVQPNREDHSPLGPQPSPPRRLNPKPRDVSKR
jgi:hypothetical protein